MIFHMEPSLVKQLQEKTTKRVYEAICYGEFKEASGTINAPIGRDEKEPLEKWLLLILVKMQ